MREAKKNSIGTFFKNSGVALIVIKIPPFNLSDDSLSMSGLQAIFVEDIRALTERSIGLLGEHVGELAPVVLHGLVILEDLSPELG